MHVNTDVPSLSLFSLLSMISPYVFVFGDKRPCFCNESLTGGLCYLILFGCENNNVLFTAAMGQIWPLCLKSAMIKAGWCIAAGLCVSGDKDNGGHILSEDNVLVLRDNKGMLSPASLPHYSNLISPAAARGAAQGSLTTFKASCIVQKTGKDECTGTLSNCINSMNAL